MEIPKKKECEDSFDVPVSSGDGAAECMGKAACQFCDLFADRVPYVKRRQSQRWWILWAAS